MLTLHNNILCSLDTETTGRIDGYHDLVQVAIVPLDGNLDPMDLSPFYMTIRPDHPTRASKKAMAVNGLSLAQLASAPSLLQVADCFDTWFEDLRLPVGRKLVSLTHNAAFDIPFIKHWLGELGFEKYFHFVGRDSMFLARGLNDTAAWQNKKIPFNRTGLGDLCEYFGIQLDDHHDSLADALATAKVYRELLRMESCM